MPLHSSEYIRNLVGQVPSKMLSLRQDEVSVFNRMNIQGRRRISLPSKLSGITEKENSDTSVIENSLNKSYSQMKSKLDELEEYNQNLEKQLNSIFSSISESVNKADKSYNPLIQQMDNLKNIIIEEPHKRILTSSSFPDSNVKSDRNQIDTVREYEQEHKKLIPHLEEQFLIANTNNTEAQKGESQGKNKLFNKCLTEVNTRKQIKNNYEKLKNITEDGEEFNFNSRGIYAFTKSDTNGDKEVKKHLTLHLEEEMIKPKTYLKPVSYRKTPRSKSTGENPFACSSSNSTELLQMKCKENQKNNSECRTTTSNIRFQYQCSQDENERDDEACEVKRNKLISANNLLAVHKGRRRLSSVDHPFSTFSEAKREEKNRRISTGSYNSPSEYEINLLSDKNKHERYEELNNNDRQYCYGKSHKNQRTVSSVCSTETSSISSLVTIIEDNIEDVKELPLSPPEYLNFHDESESVDEFFLFSEDVLNVDFDSVCEELARFSEDMGKVLESTETNFSFLKAAKASDEWKTLWIYRGRNQFYCLITMLAKSKLCGTQH
jgi:hypothetical protein